MNLLASLQKKEKFLPEQMSNNADKPANGNGTGDNELPKRVVELLVVLRSVKKDHLDLLQQIITADNSNLFHVDLVVIAAMHRSLALIDGFSTSIINNIWLELK